MDARFSRAVVLAAAAVTLGASLSYAGNYRTPNFVVSAPTPQIAQQIGTAAEKFRSDLAKQWLGHEMPTWSQPCPITAQVADNLGAGGATSFLFERGEVYGWRMTIQGSLERILDSVLPHEVTHTIFATHFRRPLPRWADEGACTTVEHPSEKTKQQVMLVDFLRTGRGIAFSRMFAMKEYPHDVMPLYSQGYSLARYLIAQGGQHKFLNFLSDGLQDENWPRAIKSNYNFDNLAVLQETWLDWVRRGSPNLEDKSQPRSPTLLASEQRRPRPEPNLIYHGRAEGQGATDTRTSFAAESAATAGEASAAGGAAASRKSQGWHAPGASAADLPLAAAGEDQCEDNGLSSEEAPAAHQVTRPQPVHRPRQIILEWSKQAPADLSTADNRTAYNQPITR